MPKQKQLLKLNKKKEKAIPIVCPDIHIGPQTADEYLAAGVSLEEAGEKWRAGDSSKSSRFFVRAIETYEAGLKQFTHSFDLVYNKARLQYELSQQPRLLAELPISLVELLQLTLESHRAALHLKQDDADALFNTAQVLTSLGEVISEGGSATSDERDDALKKLQEALDLFQRCFSIQEYQLNETQKMMTDMKMSDDPGHQAEDQPQSVNLNLQFSNEEQWASIVESVTTSTLLDTTIAQIETLTAICGLMVSQNPTGLQWVEGNSRPMLARASTLSEGSDRVREILLSTANFTCALADAAFRTGSLNLNAYQEELTSAFGKDIDIPNFAQALCDRADASLAFTASMRATIDMTSINASDLLQLNDIQWKYLTQALTDLTAATKLPDLHNLPKIHLRRGDCELLRYSLGRSPQSYKYAAQSADLLLENADTYYRGAMKLAMVEMAGQEEAEALVKEAVASSLNGNEAKLSELLKTHSVQVSRTLDDMRDENLIGIEDFARLQQ